MSSYYLYVYSESRGVPSWVGTPIVLTEMSVVPSRTSK
jgi:hypothetical protein